MKNKFYLTTAIPYVNADPHIGFAMELIQGDVLARAHRQMGADTRFINGSDENALKNVQAAEKAGVAVQQFVDEHVHKFVKLSKELNVSNDDFIRTTEPRHVAAAQKLWLACAAAGDIYKKKYHGLYCIGCEEFKTKKDLTDGLCPEHHTKPEDVEEENYFFKLSKYEKQLANLLDSGELKILPETRKNEMREFIRGGLEDFSISRSNARAKNWGIDVPGDSTQKIYVWFDALINYVTALGYGSGDEKLFQKYWTENDQRCHLIGKGISRFHAIYWPAMLLSAGLKPPTRIYIHGYVNIDGEKISKSTGNTVDPFTMIKKYGLDTVRYFLLREIPSGEDGDFSEEKLVARYNGDLANGLGNLVERVATLIDTRMDGEVIYHEKLLPDIEELNEVEDDTEIIKAIDQFKLHEALALIWRKIDAANVFINDEKPWALVDESPEQFQKVILALVDMIHHIMYNLEPFIPETAARIRAVFGDTNGKEIPNEFKFFIKKGAGLFPRLS